MSIVDNPNLVRRASPTATPRKDDTGKPNMATIDPLFMMELATVLSVGDAKYGIGNWCQSSGLKWSQLASAAERHMQKWLAGEEFDHEDGLSHLVHIASCMMMLRHYERGGNYTESDDRRFKCPELIKGEMTMEDIKRMHLTRNIK